MNEDHGHAGASATVTVNLAEVWPVETRIGKVSGVDVAAEPGEVVVADVSCLATGPPASLLCRQGAVELRQPATPAGVTDSRRRGEAARPARGAH